MIDLLCVSMHGRMWGGMHACGGFNWEMYFLSFERSELDVLIVGVCYACMPVARWRVFLSGMLIVAICLVDVRGGVGYLCC